MYMYIYSFIYLFFVIYIYIDIDTVDTLILILDFGTLYSMNSKPPWPNPAQPKNLRVQCFNFGFLRRVACPKVKPAARGIVEA